MSIFIRAEWRLARHLQNFNSNIILLLLVAVIAAASLKNSFLAIDDYSFIVNNPSLEVTWQDIPSLFMTAFGKVPSSLDENATYLYYRPFLSLLYSFNYKIWGINPVGYHVTNIILHLLSAILVYQCGLFLFHNTRVALIAAALFAIHPVHHEVVHRVAMNEIIYGLGVIASLYFFLRDWKYASWIAFALALFSKESAVLLLFALFLLSIRNVGYKKAAFSMIPYGFIFILYLLLRSMAVNFLMNPFADDITLSAQLLTCLAALAEYIRLLFIPYPLALYYPARVYSSLLHPQVIISLGIILLLLLFAWKVRKRDYLLLLPLLSLIMLVPALMTTNKMILTPETGFIADRQLYVPSMFFSLFLSASILLRADGPPFRFGFPCMTIVILLFTGMTFISSSWWRDDTSFKAIIMRTYPQNILAHMYRGEMLYSQGNLDGAQLSFQAVLDTATSFEESLRQFTPKIALPRIKKQGARPFDWTPLRNYQFVFLSTQFDLGRIFYDKHLFDQARRKFKLVLAQCPDHAGAHYFLGEIFLKEKQFSRAAHEFNIIMMNTKTSKRIPVYCQGDF